MLSKAQISLIQSLNRKSGKKATGMFCVEGEKLCEELLKSNFKIRFAIVTSSFAEKKPKLIQEATKRKIEVHQVREHDFKKISSTVTPQGILMVAEQKISKSIPNSSFILLDGISDPGNMGTIIRTANWFGFKNILLYNNCTNIYSPKVLRATMGALFHLNFYTSLTIDEINNIKKQNFKFYGAYPHAEKDLKDIKPSQKFVIILGNEAKGISEELGELIDIQFSIKGKGKIESLNVAISSAIAMYHFANFLRE